MSSRILKILSFTMMFFFLGCNENKTFYVEGTVLFENAVLSKAIVSFIPAEDSPEATFASGTTNENGVFTLTVRPAGKDEKGVRPGDYIVTIERYKDEPSRMEKLPSGDTFPIFDLMIPAHYTTKEQSGLRAKVEKKTKNIFEFHLKK